jgi:hypothetical protein
VSDVRPGPIRVIVSGDTLAIGWPDENAQTWTAEFSLDPARPLITRVALRERVVMQSARPQYWASTGKRRGRAGFDEFFDFPGNDPEGTRRFEATSRPQVQRLAPSATASRFTSTASPSAFSVAASLTHFTRAAA